MAQRSEIPAADGHSIFRIETSGKVRLILRPEDRPVLVGQLIDRFNGAQEASGEATLLLFKPVSQYNHKSYTLGIQMELIEAMPGVKAVAIHTRDRNEYHCTNRAKIQTFGLAEQKPEHRNAYIFLDLEHWTRVGGLDDVVDFLTDQKAARRVVIR